MLSGAKWMLVAAGLVAATPAFATEKLEFFTTSVNQLGAQEKLREATLTAASGPADQKFDGCVRSTQAFAMRLRADAAGLREMKLEAPLGDMVPGIAGLNDTRADLQTQFSLVCAAMATGGRPPEELAQMAAAIPELGAQIKEADHMAFEGMPLMAQALYPDGVDPRDENVRLAITRAQRDALVAVIDQNFPGTVKGKTLQELMGNTNDSYCVASAAILKVFLTKDKASDEK